MTRIVVLNGIGSVGKSSVARAMQGMSRRPLLHVAMDGFLEMLPEPLQDGPDGIHYVQTDRGTEVRVGPVGERLLRGMVEAVAALAASGNDLIFDTVMGREEVGRCRARFARFESLFVGLVAPLAVIEAREAARGDRLPGLAREQMAWVHSGIDDDLTLDMGRLSSDAAARLLCDRFGL